MIVLSTSLLAPQLSLSSSTMTAVAVGATITTSCSTVFLSPHRHIHKNGNTSMCRASSPSNQHQHILAKCSSSNSITNENTSTTLLNHQYNSSGSSSSSLRYVTNDTVLDDDDRSDMFPSAAAIASAIRRVSSSPVEFVQKIEKNPKGQGLVLPSTDFQRLCLDQFDLFRRIVDPNAFLSVYVRPAGSYVMDRLELRRVTFYPKVDGSDIVILIGDFTVPTGLRATEAALSNQQVEVIPECRTVVFPMVKHPFILGFLVAELPHMELERQSYEVAELPFPEGYFSLPPSSDFQTTCCNHLGYFSFTAEQRLNAINISRSLAMAYVMDQKAMLLQQTSWQNNLRMSNLVEQIHGSLSSIRTLSKMLSVHLKRSEIASDIVEDIMVQGDLMRDTLQQLQDVVHLTKANILRFNEESLKRIRGSDFEHELSQQQFSEDLPSHISDDKQQNFGRKHSLTSLGKDLEMPMPPQALAPLQQDGIRPCSVSDVLIDLVRAVEPLACKQRRVLELRELSQSLEVAIVEPALRQALGNLIEGALLRTNVGGRVDIASMNAPAGGVLIVIDDDGPDMHYMTQMHSLTPFGAELFSDHKIEDNMTWNFVAGLTVAREILENYGCVLRIISPRTSDAALGTGGTRIEVWLPTLVSSSDNSNSAHEA